MSRRAIGLLLLVLVATDPASSRTPAPRARNAVGLSYGVPTNAEFRPIYDVIKEKRVLERLADLLGRIRLPAPLMLKLDQCGEVNSWYEPETRTVTVCYEYLQDVLTRAPADKSPEGVTRHEALVGPTVQVFFHESAHALFDLLRVPILGREEDAADQLAAYTILLLEPEQARQIIDGTAYYFGSFAKVDKPTKDDFSDVHGLWSQRFYNLVCLAYGSDDKAFGYVVEKGYLPKDRAEGCGGEYDQVDLAFRRLIEPNLAPRNGRDQRR